MVDREVVRAAVLVGRVPAGSHHREQELVRRAGRAGRIVDEALLDCAPPIGEAPRLGGLERAKVELVVSLPADSASQPDLRAENRELGERLKAAVAALPAAQREAFLLQYEGGLSLAEIAELTGAGVETVKSRLRYAVSKLKADLADLRESSSQP